MGWRLLNLVRAKTENQQKGVVASGMLLGEVGTTLLGCSGHLGAAVAGLVLTFVAPIPAAMLPERFARRHEEAQARLASEAAPVEEWM
jgi:hypothetical protein